MITSLIMGVLLQFAWDQSPSGADGYILAIGSQSGTYEQEIDIGPATTAEIDIDLTSGSKYVIAKAYNNGPNAERYQSEPSNELKIRGKPQAPLQLRLSSSGQ